MKTEYCVRHIACNKNLCNTTVARYCIALLQYYNNLQCRGNIIKQAYYTLNGRRLLMGLYMQMRVHTERGQDRGYCSKRGWGERILELLVLWFTYLSVDWGRR